MGLDLSRSNHEASTMLLERIFASVSSSNGFVNALEPTAAVRD